MCWLLLCLCQDWNAQLRRFVYFSAKWCFIAYLKIVPLTFFIKKCALYFNHACCLGLIIPLARHGLHSYRITFSLSEKDLYLIYILSCWVQVFCFLHIIDTHNCQQNCANAVFYHFSTSCCLYGNDDDVTYNFAHSCTTFNFLYDWVTLLNKLI